MKPSPAKNIAIYGILGALMFAAKMALVFLPNIEPVSLLVMLYAVVFGWEGLYSVYVYILLEFAMWGIHYWSACYLYIWLILFIAARLLKNSEHPLLWASVSGVFGLSFGALCAIVYFVIGGWNTAVSWWAAGIPMDIVHGVANFVIAFVLFKPMRKLLERLSSRYFGL